MPGVPSTLIPVQALSMSAKPKNSTNLITWDFFIRFLFSKKYQGTGSKPP
jgi:hypothetical protein